MSLVISLRIRETTSPFELIVFRFLLFCTEDRGELIEKAELFGRRDTGEDASDYFILPLNSFKCR
jgi:hypothetical protein